MIHIFYFPNYHSAYLDQFMYVQSWQKPFLAKLVVSYRIQSINQSINEALSWFDMNLMFSLPNITQNMFCNFPKTHNQLTLKFTIYYTIYYITQSSTLRLHWWHVKCPLHNILLKMALWGIYHIIREFPMIFNADLRLIWAKCYLRNHWPHCI